ncbi:MAG: aldo/keto reductase [Lachnospiraceae bacterium]|nr:aldo/keto reductase [Lachnospiraceae bacterium]
MDTFLLRNQVEIPVIGFGTYKTTDGENADIIRQAIEAGYRYLDTASIYGNEQAVGRAIGESGVPREDLFLCSKVWRERLGYSTTREDFETSCKNLETDYLDLYLVHWPRPKDLQADWRTLLLETWRAMEEFYRQGRVRAIGVSNFLPHHLNFLLENTSIFPVINQIEFHPGYIQKTTVDFCRNQGIQVSAWSPMGRGRVMKEPLLVEMAEKYQVSVAQLCIRFALQCGVLPLPKSSSWERMRQNLDVFQFEIERDDMYQLLTLPQVGWSGEHPDRERVPAQA